MENFTEEEIFSALLREVELLEAEGESALHLDREAVENLRQRRDEKAFYGVATTEAGEYVVAAKHYDNQLSEKYARNTGERPPSFTLPAGNKQTRWEALRKIVLESPLCQAHVKPGKKIVFGVGNLDAEIFFCGEAPGADEEIEGEPFVGRAGQLLTKIIETMGLRREDVYIGNMLNWRPEMPTEYGNRPPTLRELELCSPFLHAQVDIVAPKVIVALGTTAARGLLGLDTTVPLGAVRGCWHKFAGIPVMPTFHPSFLLRNQTNATKRIVWEDMLQVMEKLSMPISEKQRRCFL
ncbi:MAG: uracil-DNA glycosylase [Puniceicoccales bacterium]|nr:uracil-DNA glycosylase [Puniceicoccales bacterium]